LYIVIILVFWYRNQTMQERTIGEVATLTNLQSTMVVETRKKFIIKLFKLFIVYMDDFSMILNNTNIGGTLIIKRRLFSMRTSKSCSLMIKVQALYARAPSLDVSGALMQLSQASESCLLLLLLVVVVVVVVVVVLTKKKKKRRN